MEKKMIRFTRKYFILECLSCADECIKKLKAAEKKDEELYQRLYKKESAIFVKSNDMSFQYHNAAKILCNLEESIYEPNISEEDRICRIEYKEIFEHLYKKQIKYGTAYHFDKELCKRKFAERIDTNIRLYSNLPKYILDKVADIRVLALGYASTQVKREIRKYCTILRYFVKTIRENAFATTDEAESYLTQKLNFNDYDDYLILGLEEKDGDIYLKGERDTLLITNGKILEGKGHAIYAYDDEKLNSAWSRIVAAELERVNKKFKVHFMVLSCNEQDEDEIWYLTIQGTDIIAI